MLTLLETKDKILSLDTDPDIIRNACQQLLADHNANHNAEATTTSLAQDILRPYLGKVEITELITALVAALAALTAGTVKIGKETAVLKSIIELLTEDFMQVSANRFMLRLKENPEQAKKELFDQLAKL